MHAGQLRLQSHTYIGFPLQQWMHERTSVLRFTYIVLLSIPTGKTGGLDLMHYGITTIPLSTTEIQVLC